jgi:CRISPR-associated endonuclease/helicase Cas3
MKNDQPREILAKPSGVLLKTHVRNLLDQAEAAFEQREFVIEKYREMTGDDFVLAVKDSARWHDAGKSHKDWQEPCRRDFEAYQLLPESKRKTFRGENLRVAGIRHEIASLEIAQQRGVNLSFPVKAAVAAHHGKLSHRHRHRWHDEKYKSFEEFWREFINESDSLRLSDSKSFEQAILKRYRVAGPRAWLQMIDHRASAYEDEQELPPLGTFAYEFPFKDENGIEQKRGVQLEIEKLWDEPFAILRAPTGAGKTDAALLWAKRQVETKRADRLVIAMPTRFTANSLSIAVTQENFKNLGDSGLYHSSAWYQRIKDKQKPTREEKSFIDKEQELAQRIETPLTVTTIDHLCICLSGTREAHHAVFFGLAHSCVVIDEADFYDAFTQENIVVLLRVLRILKVPVLLMSATVPESARETYAKSGFAVEKIHEDVSDATRPRCRITKYGKAEAPEDVEELLERALNGEPTIIYANTVARAQSYYKWFKSRNFENAVLYHSRFIEPHKVAKENLLRAMLGREAWRNGTQRGVAILTQIGEISVNISADLMISDLCPLDRLAQRVGRLSRFAERNGNFENVVGELFVVEPQRKGEFYPAPYGEFRPTVGWLPNEFLLRSGELLKNGIYSAKDFVDSVNELYPRATEITSDVRVNCQELEKMVVTNWLILPKEVNEKEVTEEPDRTANWKCRDIDFQYTIFTGFETDDDYEPPTNKTELREFENRYGITISAYEYNNAKRDGSIKEIPFFVGFEDVRRPYVSSRYYDSEVGLNFSESHQDNIL